MACTVDVFLIKEYPALRFSQFYDKCAKNSDGTGMVKQETNENCSTRCPKKWLHLIFINTVKLLIQAGSPM